MAAFEELHLIAPDRGGPHAARLERGRRAHARGGADRRARPQSRPRAPAVPGRRHARARGHAEPPRATAARAPARAGRPARRVGPRRPPGLGRVGAPRPGGARHLARHAAASWRTRWTCSSRRRRRRSPSSGAARSGPTRSPRCCWPGRRRGRRRRASSPLMQDLDKEAQRIVLTSRAGAGGGHGRALRPARAHDRRAGAEGRAGGPVRTVGVPWGRRVAGLQRPDGAARSDVAGGVDGGPGRHEAIAAAAGARASPRDGWSPATRPRRRRSSPSTCRRAERLRAAARRGRGGAAGASGHGALRRADRAAPPAAPAARVRSTRRRPRRPRGAARSSRALETGTPDRALLTLAPLFERHDPAAVAAALYELWTDRRRRRRAGRRCRTFPATAGCTWESARRTAPR